MRIQNLYHIVWNIKDNFLNYSGVFISLVWHLNICININNNNLGWGWERGWELKINKMYLSFLYF